MRARSRHQSPELDAQGQEDPLAFFLDGAKKARPRPESACTRTFEKTHLRYRAMHKGRATRATIATSRYFSALVKPELFAAPV